MFVPPLYIRDWSQDVEKPIPKVWKEDDRWRRLPFIGKGEEVGWGQETTVKKMTLAKENVSLFEKSHRFFKEDHVGV